MMRGDVNMQHDMRKVLKRMTAGVCVGAMLLGVSACGTKDEADVAADNQKSNAAFDVAQVKKDDRIAAMLPKSITEDNKFTVGVSPDYAPAEFLDTDGKTPIGYDMDMAKAVAAVFGLKFSPTAAEFDSILPSIGSKFDVGVSGFTMDPARKDVGEFVSFLNVGASFVVRKGNPKKLDAKNLCGHGVAVQTGTVHETTVKKFNDECVAAGKKPIDIQSMKDQTVVATNVVSGKADAFCADSPVAGYAIKQSGDKLEPLGKAFNMTPEAVVVKKGDMQTAKAVQAAVQKLIDDGTYAKILKTWGNESGAITKSEINDYSSVQ
ncbi:polar amino acid transport system substrate-binding protein [Bifidobacterium bohemicum]|uniref:ABC transporter, solute-binding protein n=2 Tax=Bifidobacterium bohemicum TaxID=638617 RepID=A0A086ZK61_9BIFI|nr:ABC transporter, solute-binding protein [Bifidobacterium bohemicum DSM 22767]SCB84733.1 polar amino acid transport system substrate-binding protein [Bifidobacterium bohemicum]